jgi:hypothetical protein
MMALPIITASLLIATQSTPPPPPVVDWQLSEGGIVCLTTEPNGDRWWEVYPWPWFEGYDDPSSFEACVNGAILACGQGKVRKVSYAVKADGSILCEFDCVIQSAAGTQ